MRRWIREPLLHFVLLGAALFAVYAWLGGPEESRGEIRVTRGKIEQLATGFARTWQRPPTEAELRGLVDEYLKEEVLSREAIAIGLDRDDTVIRRRLRQKMEFIADEVSAQLQPTDEQLQAYLEAHPDRYRVDPRYTFRQIYFSRDRRGSVLDGDVREALAKLRQGRTADPGGLGDPLMVDERFVDASSARIARDLGPGFVEELATVSDGHWHGPIESAFGAHLVLVEGRTAARLPALEEVRADIERDWYNARRLEANDRLVRDLLETYRVEIEWPSGDATPEIADGEVR